ncbi:MAG TPA: pitrilysin family protein, partial [Gemmatimonadaceae bacterium]
MTARRWWRAVVALVLGATLVMGTAPRAALEAQTPAADQADSLTTMYTVEGVRVIHRLATTSDIVFAGLYLLGGVRQVTPETAGIEVLLLEASERGTRTYPRDRLRQTMARLGTSIDTRVTADWTSLALRATTSTFDSTWRVLASRVMEPQLDSTEVEIIREQILAAVRQRRDVPDALVEFLADSFAFEGHPYALPPSGTEASLSRLTVADLRRYHREQFVKSRMLLVVVGNVPRARIEQLVRATIGRLPQGDYVWTLPDPLPREPSDVLAVNRPLPTNYILGRYPGPRADSPDYHALRIATAILSGQLFSEVRSRRNLTYAVEAPFVERAVAIGGLYVTTVQPEVTLEVMRQQVLALRNGMVNESALEQLIRQFTTHYFLDNESAEDQADFLARAYLFTGDYRRAMRFADELRAVTPQDIRRVAQRYLRDVQFV